MSTGFAAKPTRLLRVGGFARAATLGDFPQDHGVKWIKGAAEDTLKSVHETLEAHRLHENA